VSVHTTTALTQPLCLYALTLFSHIHCVRMQHSFCHFRCVCVDHNCSGTNVAPAYAPPFSEQRLMVCHIRCDKPRSSAGDTKCDADSLHNSSNLSILLRGHPVFEPHIPSPRESVSTLIGDQLLSSSDHAEPLPFHVSQTALVTNSHKQNIKIRRNSIMLHDTELHSRRTCILRPSCVNWFSSQDSEGKVNRKSFRNTLLI